MYCINLNFARDFNSEHVGDFAEARAGYKCINSDARLKLVRGIEIGNIFKLGTKFSESMKAEFLDNKGKSLPFTVLRNWLISYVFSSLFEVFSSLLYSSTSRE